MNMRRPLVLFANLLLKSAALTLLIFSVAPVSAAETFPDKPVSLMVPYPAGGLSDVIARFVNMVGVNYFDRSATIILAGLNEA
jgi:tripartite-type tricarboxylate transporter receptor subunit TctC